MSAFVTLEVRWFMRGPIPREAENWFSSLGPPAEPESRTDRYLIPLESEDLGLKFREGLVQAKQRTRTLGTLGMGARASGRVEAWRKWDLGDSGEPPSPGWVDVAKTRRQRAARGLGTGARCVLELAEVEVRGEAWWSICLEAWGPTEAARWRCLRAGARRWLGSAPALPAEASMGYPAWLAGLAPQHDFSLPDVSS